MSAKPKREDEDLEALFDRIAAETAATDTAAPCAVEPANESVAMQAGEGDAMFQRIGHLTRALHDSLRELGYSRKIEEAAQSLPDARARLDHIAQLTGQAAERVLGAVESGQTACNAIGSDAGALAPRWDALYAGALSVDEFKQLAGDTHAFLAALPKRADEANAHLHDIMMAQDFHDLSGQVLKRVGEIANRLENDLLKLLLETCPVETRPAETFLSGPPLPGRAQDVVQDQAQVDQLLESLGF
jgi:chemotaxis protein CheZ